MQPVAMIFVTSDMMELAMIRVSIVFTNVLLMLALVLTSAVDNQKAGRSLARPHDITGCYRTCIGDCHDSEDDAQQTAFGVQDPCTPHNNGIGDDPL